MRMRQLLPPRSPSGKRSLNISVQCSGWWISPTRWKIHVSPTAFSASDPLRILSTLRANLGSLDRIKRVIKTLGMVNSTPEFTNHPEVINGCSELFRNVFGEDAGVGARSAVGMILPGNIAVEIEGIFEIDV